MPPKKKARVAPSRPRGAAAAFIDELFSEVPSQDQELKNGHVLHLYLRLNKSPTDVARELQARDKENRVDATTGKKAEKLCHTWVISRRSWLLKS
jgi:hypothetical protein